MNFTEISKTPIAIGELTILQLSNHINADITMLILVNSSVLTDELHFNTILQDVSYDKIWVLR